MIKVCHPNCAMRSLTVPLRRFWHSAPNSHANNYLTFSLCFEGFKDFLACGIAVA
jgi:hypothetical protein